MSANGPSHRPPLDLVTATYNPFSKADKNVDAHGSSSHGISAPGALL